MSTFAGTRSGGACRHWEAFETSIEWTRFERLLRPTSPLDSHSIVDSPLHGEPIEWVPPAVLSFDARFVNECHRMASNDPFETFTGSGK